MSLLLENTGEKTNLQKGDRVVVEFFDDGGFFTIACGRAGKRLLLTPHKDRWTARGDKNNMGDIIIIFSDIYDVTFKKVAETQDTIAFAII